MRIGERSSEDSAWCEVSVSPIVTQRHDLVDQLERERVRVRRAARSESNAPWIHVIAWEELVDAKTENRLRLVVIADRAEESKQREAARLGAAALIAADRVRVDLGSVVRCVTAGYYPIPYSIASTLVSRLDSPPSSIGVDELALLKRLLEGATVAEVADGMGCSERHARRRLRTVWDRMGVSGRREGLATAARWGLHY